MSSGKNPCAGCMYYRRMYWSGDGETKSCDYLLVTGHARSLICPPGEGCTVKKIGPPAPGELDADRRADALCAPLAARCGEKSIDPIPGYFARQKRLRTPQKRRTDRGAGG